MSSERKRPATQYATAGMTAIEKHVHGYASPIRSLTWRGLCVDQNLQNYAKRYAPSRPPPPRRYLYRNAISPSPLRCVVYPSALHQTDMQRSSWYGMYFTALEKKRSHSASASSEPAEKALILSRDWIRCFTSSSLPDLPRCWSPCFSTIKTSVGYGEKSQCSDSGLLMMPCYQIKTPATKSADPTSIFEIWNPLATPA